MDIFKLLSRSTKPTKRSSQANGAQSSKLPSAGTSANPQLYNDPVPESRGKKRKLADRAQVEDTQEVEDAELNFFAPKAENKKKKKETRRERAETDGHDAPAKTMGKSDEASKLLDEDDCRQTLRSHRLKVTLLPSKSVGKQEEKKKSKKRTGEDATTEKKKDDHNVYKGLL